MSSFITPSFRFFTFDYTSKSHIEFLKVMKKDEDVSKYLGSIEDFLIQGDSEDELNNAYLVGRGNNIVGYLNLFNGGIGEEMHYAVSPNFRGIRNNSNETMGCQIVKEASTSIFRRHKEIEYISLFIEKMNIRSIKVAERAGFKLEKIWGTLYEYHKYSERMI